MITTLAPPELLSAEEFFQWWERPENAAGQYELEAGKVVEMPPPSELHGVVCLLVSHLLAGFLLPRGGYVMTNDTGLIIKRRPDTVRGPDVMAFLTRPAFKDLKFAPVDRVPTLAVEVLSPSDRLGKTLRRVNQYLKRGIPLIWVIDPDERNMIVYSQTGSPQTLDETDELTGDGILPGFACKVSDFFAWPTTTTDTP